MMLLRNVSTLVFLIQMGATGSVAAFCQRTNDFA